jgi:hypothetical protein
LILWAGVIDPCTRGVDESAPLLTAAERQCIEHQYCARSVQNEAPSRSLPAHRVHASYFRESVASSNANMRVRVQEKGGGADRSSGSSHVIVYGGRAWNILCYGALRKPCACAQVEKFSEISRNLDTFW